MVEREKRVDAFLKPKRRKNQSVEEQVRMPTVWLSLKRSLRCKSEPSEVHDPKAKIHNNGSILNRKPCRSGCSRSIANLKDVVIHGSKRHLEKPPSCSPRSIGSSEFLNPITHEVILSNSNKCELRITGFNGFQEGDSVGSLSSSFEDSLRPLTPGPGGHLGARCSSYSFKGVVGNLTPPRRTHTGLICDQKESHGFASSNLDAAVLRNCGGFASMPRGSLESNATALACHKCREQFVKMESLEAHHLSKHAVTELLEGDSSRKIVEIICRTSWLKSESNNCRIQRILKVHNMQKTLARFEEHRESVKSRASRLPKKHPRCLADGNELLRFHGTTIACNLGTNGASSLCASEKCSVCRIIRHGFTPSKELRGGVGVFTTSTSARALESVELCDGGESFVKKALLVCRVIAGRVHKPLENLMEIATQSGFDSLAGKIGLYSNIEELYLLSPRALLPCFVVICKSC